MKACKNCYLLTDKKRCPRCNGEVSKRWSGYLIMIDRPKSEIAKKIGVETRGKYALRVK